MTFQVGVWASHRRYGNALLRFVMLTLADWCNDREMRIDLPFITEATEISPSVLSLILNRLVEDGHLVSWSKVRGPEPDSIVILWPEEALPERARTAKPPPTCPRRLREQVIERFQFVCSYCRGRGNSIVGPDGRKWHVDRIVPGGPYQPDNVTLSCSPCNSRKSDGVAPAGTRSLAQILQ